MSNILAEELEEFEQWRQDNLKRIDLLAGWLEEQELDSAGTKTLLSEMHVRLRSEQFKVAFVAESSRGKSELINAIFFANSGRRIMPVMIGRTTMCPVEIGYDKTLPPCIRLLPLETRLEDQALAQWRYENEDAWVVENLDIDNVDRLAEAMKKINECKLITPYEARELGLWVEDDQGKPFITNPLGLIEVPKWRHAIVNYPHPLLKRGISILDTPGLNSVGLEPELALDLLPQAHAVMFVLSADSGVTRSDLQIWEDYLSGPNTAERPCYVLLNKIDVLWDDLISPEDADIYLEEQRKRCAEFLHLPVSRILPVSAQKALVGKIKADVKLLENSKILSVERMLVREILPKRQEFLKQALVASVTELETQVTQRLNQRVQLIDQQLDELQNMNSKNTSLANQYMTRYIGQKETLESLRQQASKMRVLEKKLIRQIGKDINHEVIQQALLDLSVAIQDTGLRVSLAKVFEKGIAQLKAQAQKAEKRAGELEKLVSHHIEELSEQYGISLLIPPSPGVGDLLTDIETLHQRHQAFFSTNQILRLRRSHQAEQVFKALLTRARSIFDEAFEKLELWSNNAYSVLVVQVRDVERLTQKLYDGIQRVYEAKEPLNERVDQLEDDRLNLFQTITRFDKIMLGFKDVSEEYRNSLYPDEDKLIVQDDNGEEDAKSQDATLELDKLQNLKADHQDTNVNAEMDASVSGRVERALPQDEQDFDLESDEQAEIRESTTKSKAGTTDEHHAEIIAPDFNLLQEIDLEINSQISEKTSSVSDDKPNEESKEDDFEVPGFDLLDDADIEETQEVLLNSNLSDESEFEGGMPPNLNMVDDESDYVQNVDPAEQGLEQTDISNLAINEEDDELSSPGICENGSEKSQS